MAGQSLVLNEVLHEDLGSLKVGVGNEMASFRYSKEGEEVSLSVVSTGVLVLKPILEIVDLPWHLPKIYVSLQIRDILHPDSLRSRSVFHVEFSSIDQNGNSVVKQIINFHCVV